MLTKYTNTLIAILFAFTLFSQNVPSYVPKNGLVGWWPFNGNANDESGNGYHGTVYGATLTSDRNGNTNSAYSFNGISDYIEFVNPDPKNNFTFFNQDFSFSIWIKKSVCNLSSGGQKVLISEDFDGTPYSQTSALSICGIDNDHIDTNRNHIGDGVAISAHEKRYQHYKLLPREGWIHIVYINKTRCFYINNQKFCLNIKDDSYTRWDTRVTNMLLSKGLTRADKFFDGVLDNYALYNRSLTDQEVEQLSNEIPYCSNVTPVISLIGKNTFCEGDTTILITNTFKNAKYQWYKEGIKVPNANDSIYVAKQSGNYTIGVSNDSVCESRSFGTSLKVYPIPSSVKINANDTTLCEGETVVLTTENKEGYRFQWKKYGNYITGATKGTLTVNSPGEYSVVTYSYCNDSLESRTMVVHYKTIPPSNLIVDGKTTFCYGDSVKLKLDKKYVNAFQWFNGSSAISGANDSIYYAKTSGNYSVRLLDGRCFKNSTQDSITVELQQPKLHFFKTLFCEGDTTNAYVGENNLSWGYKGVNSYVWFLNNQEIPNSQSPNPYLTNINLKGSYKVKLISLNCVVFSDTIEINYLPSPKVNSLSSGDTLKLCSPTSIPFRISNFLDYSLKIGNNKNYQLTWRLSNDSSFNDVQNQYYHVFENNKDTIYDLNIDLMFWSGQNFPVVSTCKSAFKIKVSPSPTELKIVDSILYSGGKLKLFTIPKGVWTNLSPDSLKIDSLGFVTSLVDVLHTQITAGVMIQVTNDFGCSRLFFKQIILKPKYDVCSSFFANLISENDRLDDAKCTGKLSSNVGGGLQPYSYAWSTGATTANLTDLCAQTYTLEVTDKNNCKLTVNKAVGMDSVINPCANFKAFISSVEPTGINAATCNGSAEVKAEGGQAPYSYVWNNGVKTAAITEVCQGEYQVTVTDKNKCSISLNAKVAIDSTKNACNGYYAKVVSVKDDNGMCNGEIHTQTFGGKLPYSYKWNTSSTDSVLTKACKGVYTLEVMDANKCSFTLEKEVKSTAVIDPCKDFYAVVSELKDDVSEVSCNGKIVVQAKGGKSPYTYNWESGDTTSILENKCAGSYSATISDVNNCKVVVATSISKIQPQAVKLEAVITTKDASSSQTCDGNISIQVTNGTAPYTYSHSNGETGIQRTSLCSGVYTLTVKDAKGNEQTLNYVISNPVNTIQTIVSILKDSVSLDTLKTRIQNECSIAYDAIDSVKIKEIVVTSKDSILVTWSVYSKDKQTYVSQNYVTNKGAGVYTLALTMYCKELKGIGSYFTASQKAYLEVGEETSTMGIGLKENESIIKIWPNPFTDKVEVSLSNVSDYKLEVLDITGKNVYKQEYTQTKQIELDFSHLTTGEYILKVMNKDDVQIRKISKTF
jgi:hypothetical protein